jgi:hypothetical protein
LTLSERKKREISAFADVWSEALITVAASNTKRVKKVEAN